VRSPHGHAAIRAIDKRIAAAQVRVHAVLTRADLLPHLTNERLIVGLPSKSYKQDINRPALAIDEVVHVGEPVAIVIAVDRYVAEDAAALVEVDYEPLPAIAGLSKTRWRKGRHAHTAIHRTISSPNSVWVSVMSSAAFAAAPHVFRETLWQHRGGSHSIECRGAVAAYDAIEDKLTLWSSTANAALGQAAALRHARPRRRPREVVTPDVGGGFGRKLVFYPEDVVTALAAMLLKAARSNGSKTAASISSRPRRSATSTGTSRSR